MVGELTSNTAIEALIGGITLFIATKVVVDYAPIPEDWKTGEVILGMTKMDIVIVVGLLVIAGLTKGSIRRILIFAAVMHAVFILGTKYIGSA